MRKAVRLSLIAGIALAAGASICTVFFLCIRERHVSVNGRDKEIVEVVVAKESLAPRTRIESTHIVVEQVAKTGLPDGYVSNPAQVLGRLLSVAVVKGQPLADSQFFPSKSIDDLLRPGMLAFQASLPERSGAIDLLYPGCIVDVFATFPLADREKGEAVVTPLLQNIQVLAVVDEPVMPPAQPKETPEEAAHRRTRLSSNATVTLEVTARQAAALQLALERGTLGLAVRSPTDKGLNPMEPMIVKEGQLTAGSEALDPQTLQLVDLLGKLSSPNVPRGLPETPSPAPSKLAPELTLDIGLATSKDTAEVPTYEYHGRTTTLKADSDGVGSDEYSGAAIRRSLGGGRTGRYGVAASPRRPQSIGGVMDRRHLSAVTGLEEAGRSRPRSSADFAELAHVTEDEIWVIAREERPQAEGPGYETPGCGAMLAQMKEKKVPLPLKHTDVKGRVCGYIATVEVTQQFHNPFSEKIEAVYVFPLPQNAAVNEFIMVIGERRIRGIIRERQEAEEIYCEARRQGHVASLLTQERPNIFTQKVANIEPGKEIDVNIKYFNTLAYVDGWYEFVFPMVVGPRFNPPGFTDGVGAVGRGKHGLSGQKTEVQYLKPHERSGHDISLAVDIDAGVKIEEIACPSHAIKNNKEGAEKVHVQLSPLDNIPNKDFVLRYKVAGKTIKSALVTHQDERGGFFTLMLYPPDDLRHVKRAPMEMVFVLDCSGSMRAQPIAKAKEAIKRALRKLEPDDTFQVIRFSQNASHFGPSPVPATRENVRKAIAYVDSLEGNGGTMMIEGIKAALDFPHDPRRFRLVSFMTDGYIGNEAQILGEIHSRLGETRIFSFGVGSAVNRYLLDRMAKLGKGAVAYIGLNDSGTEVVDCFYDCIAHPALTDVTIHWGDLEVADVYPRQVPDLFVGRPIVLTGRFKGQSDTTIRIAGRLGNINKGIAIPVTFDEAAAAHAGIACVWARKRIEDLANQATCDSNPDLPGEIKQVALQYCLMSAYTAFVAVDSSRTTASDHGVTVAVPVPVPEGVRYDTTVQD